MKSKLVLGFALVALAAALTGCISLEQRLKLNDDGSADVTVDTWVIDLSDLEKAAKELEDATPGTADQPAPADQPGTAEQPAAAAEPAETAAPPIEDEMGPAFADLPGITVKENWAKYEDKDDSRFVHTHLALTVDKLERLDGVGIFKATTFTLKTKGKGWTFAQNIVNEQEKTEKPSPESEALAAEMFKGCTFTYILETPGEVKTTNGTLAEDKRTVTWSWPLYDFSKMEKVEMKATTK